MTEPAHIFAAMRQMVDKPPIDDNGECLMCPGDMFGHTEECPWFTVAKFVRSRPGPSRGIRALVHVERLDGSTTQGRYSVTLEGDIAAPEPGVPMDMRDVLPAIDDDLTDAVGDEMTLGWLLYDPVVQTREWRLLLDGEEAAVSTDLSTLLLLAEHPEVDVPDGQSIGFQTRVVGAWYQPEGPLDGPGSPVTHPATRYEG